MKRFIMGAATMALWMSLTTGQALAETNLSDGGNSAKSHAEMNGPAKIRESSATCAFLKKMNDETIELDLVEYITDEDTDRIRELNLSESDMPDGYYIYNPTVDSVIYSIGDETTFTFIDWGRDFVLPDEDRFEVLFVTTTNRSVFRRYLSTYTNSSPGMPFFFEIEDGCIKSIAEKPMA